MLIKLFNNLIILFFKLLIIIKGYRILKARKIRQFKEATALRNEVFFEKNYIKSNYVFDVINLTSPNLKHCFLIYYKKQAIATISLLDILPSGPVSQVLFFRELSNRTDWQNYYEVSRLCVAKKHRNNNSIIFLALMFQCWKFSRKDGKGKWLFNTNKLLWTKIKKMHKNITVIAPFINKAPNGFYPEAEEYYKNWWDEKLGDMVCCEMAIENLSPHKFLNPKKFLQ